HYPSSCEEANRTAVEPPEAHTQRRGCPTPVIRLVRSSVEPADKLRRFHPSRRAGDECSAALTALAGSDGLRPGGQGVEQTPAQLRLGKMAARAIGGLEIAMCIHPCRLDRAGLTEKRHQPDQ